MCKIAGLKIRANRHPRNTAFTGGVFFKEVWVWRFARKEKISADALWNAIERAENGQIDAGLGGGVIKQRIARPGENKSKGYRSIALFRKGDLLFFVYGFFPRVSSAIFAPMKKSSSRKWLDTFFP